MLLGTHALRLDDKGRLFLPPRSRDELAGGVVMAKGQDRCVVLWPDAVFRDKAARASEVSRGNATVRSYLRVLFSSAYDQVPDRTGRITVPSTLRDYAGLGRDVVLAGNNDSFEIWDTNAWEAYLAAQEATYAEQSEEVMPGLF
ncbi:MAG: transcriptional regulator MraZ [Actinomycetota bacterium]|nr:MAG: transcriptional regulator MraZ [Actinomycetota bacterium]